MHDCRLPEDFVAEVTKRRGRRYAFESLTPERTALVVIDMQDAFVGPGGLAAARGIVPAINRLAVALRRAGGRYASGHSTLLPSCGRLGRPSVIS